jgi:glutamate-ammonia-ligase adenylyltransferase
VKDGRFDVKHSAGGMMDAEFAVQYLVLAHSGATRALLDNAGNIALLQRAEAGPAARRRGPGRRRCLPRAAPRPAPARLDEQPTQFEPDTLARERDAILALWQAVFGNWWRVRGARGGRSVSPCCAGWR